MPQVPRISPPEAREKVLAGQALLVCAYEDFTDCRAVRLEGALSIGEFRALRPTLPKDREIIFYCA